MYTKTTTCSVPGASKATANGQTFSKSLRKTSNKGCNNTRVAAAVEKMAHYRRTSLNVIAAVRNSLRTQQYKLYNILL